METSKYAIAIKKEVEKQKAILKLKNDLEPSKRLIALSVLKIVR